MKKWFFIPLTFLLACGPGEEETPPGDDAFAPAREIQKIVGLYDSIDSANPGEWLTSHPEKYISFQKYIRSKPVKADSVRNIIYIKPIGTFDSTQYNVIDAAAQFLSSVYHKRVQVLPAVMPDTFPASAFRQGDLGLQLNTQFVMKKYLLPKLPHNAVVYIALTTVDLYPKESWNYVFGQSMLKGRVGVWSVRRLCDGFNDSTNSVCLLRTLKVAAHEVGHMFSISHCKNFHCIMNGSMSLEESDRKPLYFCPECVQKLCWNNRQSLRDHLVNMRHFWQTNGFTTLGEFYQKNLTLLDSK